MLQRFWLGPLGWHDANGSLLAALARAPAGRAGHAIQVRANVFAGVFCADPFRPPAALFAALRHAGIAGVANLPSVSFLDGPLADILEQFDLGTRRELRFLGLAHEAGFRIAGCVADPAMARAMAEIGAEFLIVHDGPPLPNAPCRKPRAAAFAGFGVPIIAIDDLLRPLAATNSSCA